MNKTKPYEISKYVVLEAFRRVKANGGALRVDNVRFEKFESSLNISPAHSPPARCKAPGEGSSGL